MGQRLEHYVGEALFYEIAIQGDTIASVLWQVSPSATLSGQNIYTDSSTGASVGQVLVGPLGLAVYQLTGTATCTSGQVWVREFTIQTRAAAEPVVT